MFQFKVFREIKIMSGLFNEYKDTSKELISESASFLNKKPKRQGSNQYVTEAVFDDNFKKHKDHFRLLGTQDNLLSTDEKNYVDEFRKRLGQDNKEKNDAYLKANPEVAKKRAEQEKKRRIKKPFIRKRTKSIYSKR